MTNIILISESCFKGASIAMLEGGGALVRDVVLLGQKSLNSREYTPEAMSNGFGLYEGVQCFLNHGGSGESGGRKVQDLAGRFKNVRYEESKLQIRGDIELLKGTEAGDTFLAIAKQMPDVAGLSHNAQGKMRHDKGIDYVDEITKVFSVDLVTEPATTNGLHEEIEKEVPMDWSKLTLEEIKTHRHDLYEALIAQGAKSRDDEVKKLKEEKAAVEKEADELKVKEALRQKETRVGELLVESKLPETAITETFKGQLLEAKDEAAMKALIEDRKELVMNATGGVKDMGGGVKKIDEGKADLAKADAALD